jgi:hypothetical protein
MKTQSLYSMTNYPMKYNNQVWNYQLLKIFTVLPQFPYSILRPNSSAIILNFISDNSSGVKIKRILAAEKFE